MEKRCASRAFFSTFRAWSILCRPRRNQLHTAVSIHRRLKRDSISHVLRIGYAAAISSRRWASSEFGGLADAVDRKTVSSEFGGLADSADGKKASSLSAHKPEDDEDHLALPRRLLKKYPDLDLARFINRLKAHKRIVLHGSNKREDGGSNALKKLMRSMPHSTVLITTLSDDKPVLPDVSLRDAERLSPYVQHFRGAIVSSVTSVTVGPPAIISFNFKEPSATLDGIRENRFFTVHFLRSDQDGANLAMQFLSRPGDHHSAWKAVSKDHDLEVVKQLRFSEKRANTPQKPLAPIVKGPGVVAHLICEIMPEKCVSGIGDHAIIVAKVSSSALYDSRNVDANVNDRNGFPPLLMYSEGRFKKHGSPIEETKSEKIDLSDAAIARNAEEKAHPDMSIRRQVVTAGDPILYQAANSYMDSVMSKNKDSTHIASLKKLYATMASAPDRRARFVGALLFWQFENAMFKKSKGLQKELGLKKDLGLQMGASGYSDISATVANDEQLREVAQELAKSAWWESMGTDAAWLDNHFRAMDAGRSVNEFGDAAQRGQRTEKTRRSQSSKNAAEPESRETVPKSESSEALTEEEKSIFRRTFPKLSGSAELAASRTRSSERSETGRRRAQAKREAEKVDGIPEAEAVGSDVSIEQALQQARAQLKGMYLEVKEVENKADELDEKTSEKELAAG